MNKRLVLELERRQLERAKTDYIRWYGGLDAGYFDRIGARLVEVKRLIAEMEETDDD